ncbi:hypothetical protein E2C01_013092 [Portunus trituberculatus]|uniref:Uncharacterized protein n=1 Tax=Portunus trituberculatus TaxID=210409 RepID=A0A5B7DG57_PORTR|nr:hypothetical protein [Portunus trituberculatus]
MKATAATITTRQTWEVGGGQGRHEVLVAVVSVTTHHVGPEASPRCLVEVEALQGIDTPEGREGEGRENKASGDTRLWAAADEVTKRNSSHKKTETADHFKVRLPRGDAAASDGVRAVMVVEVLEVTERSGGAGGDSRRGTVSGGALALDHRHCGEGKGTE